MSIGALEGAWPGRGGEVRAAVPHLVWRGVFRAGLPVPLLDRFQPKAAGGPG